MLANDAINSWDYLGLANCDEDKSLLDRFWDSFAGLNEGITNEAADILSSTLEMVARDPLSKYIAEEVGSTVREVATAVSTSANDVAAEASGSSVDRNSTAYKVNSNVGADIAIAATFVGGGGGGGAKAGSAMKKAGNAVKKAFNKIKNKLKNLFKKNSNKVDDAVKNTADDATAAAENAATKADSTTTSPKSPKCKKGGGKDNSSENSANPGNSTSSENGETPTKATETLNNVKETGTAPEGYEGGKTFKNKEGKLPADGDYQEFDVDPKPPKGTSRNAERLVVDKKTGRAWYTKDHYRSFTEIK